jgi:hypothetical protein
MFKSFSETSRLYAQNYSLIEAVEAEFLRDVGAFLDSVYEKIQSATGGKAQQESGHRGNRCWWIGKPDEEDCAYLWVAGSDPNIVHPGQIELQVCAEKASQEQLVALRGVAAKPEFSTVCTVSKGKPGPFAIFTATIKYAEADPVEQVSSFVAELLPALNDAYERARASARPSAARQKAEA